MCLAQKLAARNMLDILEAKGLCKVSNIECETSSDQTVSTTAVAMIYRTLDSMFTPNDDCPCRLSSSSCDVHNPICALDYISRADKEKTQPEYTTISTVVDRNKVKKFMVQVGNCLTL